MKWPWSRYFDTTAARTAPSGEARAADGGSNYTDVLTALMLARAEGGPVDPAATAALEACAGLLSRAFTVADVSPATAATGCLSPDVLACAGREIVRRGEAVFVLDVNGGRLRALPVSDWDVRGGPDPASWWYRVDLPGPDGTFTRDVPGAGVLHVRYAVDPRQPWRGIAPLAYASTTGRVLAGVETALAGEVTGPVGHLIPVPDEAGDETSAQLRADIGALRGGVKTVETTAAGWGEGRSAAPEGDWRQRRIGADPPAGMVELRSQAALATMAACGVPAPLFGSGDGTSAREAWRRYLHGTVAPLALGLASEAARKLDTPDLKLGFDKLFASDLAGRARGFSSMVSAGMPLDKAAALAGLLSAEA